MFERWRRPVRVLHHEPSGEAYVTSDGRIVRAENLVVHPDDAERMRLGYVCMKCLEPFPVPWPIRCVACGAPVARDQRAFFEMEFAGKAEMPQPFDWEAEAASLPERAAKEKERKR